MYNTKEEKVITYDYLRRDVRH